MAAITAGIIATAATLHSASKDRGAARDAQSTNEAARQSSQDFIERQSGQAREDVLRLSPLVEQNRLAGFGSALDVIQQFAPQRAEAFQQGNINAQNILQSGLTRQQQAILGQPLSALPQAQHIGIPDFSQIALPQFQGSAGAGLATAEEIQAQQQAVPQQDDAFLAQFGGGGGLGIGGLAGGLFGGGGGAISSVLPGLARLNLPQRSN